MSGKPRVPQISPERMKILKKLSQDVREEVERRYGKTLTYEQRRDAAHKIMTEVLWTDEEEDLDKLKTDAAEVEIEGVRYRRLEQMSSAAYHGRWGAHNVEEPLYREVGVHNGRTIKPLEVRVGMIARHMTPDLGRVVGELSGMMNSRELETTMRAVGMVPPSRSFLEKRIAQMSGQMAREIECLEQAAREAAPPPTETALISCGMDRMAVRMAELAEHPEIVPAPHRKEAYVRTPPPPKEYRWRMAWVGSTTAYDKSGNALHTWRYAVEPGADKDEVAHRVSADVKWLLQQAPDAPVHCIQDGAPELKTLPRLLGRVLPDATRIEELIDFEHLMGYLDTVVDAFEPGDPANRKATYRADLLSDDDAIDRIWSGLLRRARALPKRGRQAQRDALAAALRYIRKRKHTMRYASHYKNNRPIGSGGTEGTVGLMQQRIKRRGQSWEQPGLRNVATTRSLVLSERWEAAWQPFAATHRHQVQAFN